MTLEQLLQQPDVPMIDIGVQGVMAHNAAATAWLENRRYFGSVKFPVGKLMDVPSSARRQLQRDLDSYLTNMLYKANAEEAAARLRIIKEEAERAAKQARKALVDKFMRGYMGMVKHAGWKNLLTA